MRILALNILLGAWVLLAQQASAQNIGEIDYEGLFDKYEAQVKEKTLEDGANVRELLLPGDVLIWKIRRNDKVDIRSRDQGGKGAVGCFFAMYIELRETIDTCDYKVTPEQEQRLAMAIDRIGRFYAVNSFPPVPYGKLNSYLENHRKQNLENPRQCFPETEDARNLWNSLLSDNIDEFLNELLSVARLPVVEPCL